MSRVIVVKAARDADAGVWVVESSDMPGLHIEGDTLEELTDKLPGAILDLLEASGADETVDVPVELIAHASTRIRIPAR